MSPLVEEAHSASGQWVPGPSSPRLTSREVHVWRADLDRVDEYVLAYLSGPEQERAARFSKPATGARWGRARGLLRSLLGAYLDAAPAGLTFEFGDGGKPRLAGPMPRASICFNLSHSGPLGLFAFADTPVGVDVELDRRPIDELSLARRVFGASEARRIASLDPGDRRRAFLRVWTRHEARLKCRGAGSWSPARDARAPQTGDASRPREPWIIDLDLGGGVAGALAAERAPRNFRCWELDAC